MQPDDDHRARLARIERLLGEDPVAADEASGRFLEDVPGHPMATLFRGIARRLNGDAASAIDTLAPLCRAIPDAPLPHLQLGLAFRQQGDRERALASLRRALAIKPDFGDAWFALADLLTETGRRRAADRAWCNYVSHAVSDPRLARFSAALEQNRLGEAREGLRKHLESHPNDVLALCLLADVAVREARYDRAETLLAKCLELAPGYRAARHNYAVLLMRQNRPDKTLEEVEKLLATTGSDPALGVLQAAALMRLGRYEQAIAVYEAVLEKQPGQAGIRASLGHALRAVGQRQRAVTEYKRVTALAPQSGEAYWNLANLKTYCIEDDELAAMHRQVERADLAADDRVHFHFAIGKALEDRRNFAESFRHYAAGNRLRREHSEYEPDAMTRHVSYCRKTFTSAYFADHRGYGTADPDPVFIVGLPRSGSTLVEQILASHSAVEGTMELSHITAMAKSLVDAANLSSSAPFAEAPAKLDDAAARRLGEAYIERTRPYRQEGTSFFIDKMPNNFAHIAFIHLILPNSRIIDVRRHPLACGLSVFKQHFAHGQHFSYSLEDIGRYYSDYTELMAHFDRVLPGRVHRVLYERLIGDTEGEVRRLLEYCELPFEDDCLCFYESSRAVSTPSSEQVRTPIFRDALDHWRNYEPWLAPLRAQLGSLVERYPGGAWT